MDQYLFSLNSPTHPPLKRIVFGKNIEDAKRNIEEYIATYYNIEYTYSDVQALKDMIPDCMKKDK